MLMAVSFQNQMTLFFRPLRDVLDNLTSNLSTFPYTAAQCQKFLELLKMSRGKHSTCQKKKKEHALTLPLLLDYIHDGHVVAYVGQNLHPTTVGNICLTFFFTGLIGRIWSIIC